MKPPHDEYITQETYDAVCRDRDRWAQMAMEQHQYIMQLEQKMKALEERLQTMTRAEEETAILPPENDYQALVQWLEAEKTVGRNYYHEADFNRSKMCRNLRKILGWEPDQNSLRKAQNKFH